MARAKRLPSLGVGLHLVLADGEPILPAAEVPALVSADGAFDPNMVRAGFRFYFSPAARRQHAAEIRAQFAAFRATGLALDHVNGHKHVHLHPTVARLVVEIGREYGMRVVRLPAEPVAPLRAAVPSDRRRALPWSPVLASLRCRLARAGLLTNDQVFGITWSGPHGRGTCPRLVAAFARRDPARFISTPRPARRLSSPATATPRSFRRC